MLSEGEWLGMACRNVKVESQLGMKCGLGLLCGGVVRGGVSVTCSVVDCWLTGLSHDGFVICTGSGSEVGVSQG